MTPAELKIQVALLNQQAELQTKVSSSYAGFLEAVKDYKTVQKTINQNKKIELELELKIAAAGANATQEDIDRLEILKSQTSEMEKQNKQLRSAIENTNKLSLSAAKLGATAVKAIGSLPNLVNKGIGKLTDLGLLDMEKSIKMAGLQMGILSSQSKGFSHNIRDVAQQTSLIGGSVEQLSKMQADYSDEIGRTVILSQESLKGMAAMAAASGLGAEGTAKMAADMDAQGLSAERTAEFVGKTMNDAHKMGLNASKVVKNIAGNIKLLNRYNFKDGIKGLAKMAETAAKLGVQMDMATGMADKLWDVEGAVDMSAQLQVMGGEWSKLADPFKLMYMARNDVEGLTEALGNAAAASAHLNKDGEIELSALEMHRLKIVAEQTGVAYDDLVTSGKKMYALNKVKSQLNFGMSDEAKEYIAATAEFGKDGKATIMVGADKSIKKAVSDLSATDLDTIKTQMAEKKSMEERAKSSLNFDEALKNTFNGMKVALLPIVEVLNEKLVPKLQSFVDRWNKEQWGEKIEKFATKIGEVISYFAGWIIDNPLKTAFAFGVAQFTGFLMEKANWIANGLALSTGFNMGSAVGESGGLTKTLGSLTKTLGPIAAISAAGIGGGMFGKYLGEKATEASGRKSTEAGDNWGTGLAIAGGLAGLALAPFTGGASLAITAAAVGGGALAGGLGGKYFGDMANQDAVAGPAVHDGKFNKPGGKYSKGRQIVQNGVATPIENFDKEMFIGKPGGPIDKSNKANNNANFPSAVNHTFDPIRIEGSITVNIPGQQNNGVDLLKHEGFVRNLSGLISADIQRQQNQKLKG